MAHFRTHEIIELIEVGSYPYQIPFFTREQLAKQRVYPSCEVVNIQPESTDEKVDVTDERNRFEIRVFIKYNRDDDTETKDLFDIETEILSLLETAVLADKEIVLEQKTWNRTNIKNNPLNIHGTQSTLTVVVLEKKSTTGDGTLGAQMSLTLPGPIVLDLLSEPASVEGITFDEDRMEGEKRVLTHKGDTGTRFFEYESTFALDSSIKSLIDTGNIVSVTFTKNGNDRIMDVLLIDTTKTAPYDNIERSILRAELIQ